MSSRKKNKILLSGPGLIGRKHADLLECSSRSDLVAIVAPHNDKNVEFAIAHKVPIFETIEQAFESTEIDAAIIASPNSVHTEQAIYCIERGVPVLVEKPLASDLEQAALICRTSRKFNVPVLVGHHRTYSSFLSKAKEFIDSQSFGKLVAVRGSALFRKPEHYFEDGPWRKRMGGGPIFINLIHDIGILRFLCGEITAVSAYSSNNLRQFEVEDTVAITFVFENGALGTFLLSDVAASNQSWEMTAGENPAYPHFSDVDCYHFAGTLSSLDFPTMKIRSYNSEHEASWWTEFTSDAIKTESTDPLERQLAHFEDVIAGSAIPLVSAEEGLANMRVLEAVRLSSATGRTVNMADISLSNTEV
ncbi:putative dehydrogenase [Agrobacterium vitis]|nr:putative dehydrogenase [Agrobacterium vitis]MBE1436469.1 putative dehydrogenase [Agrobacterium vitis]